MIHSINIIWGLVCVFIHPDVILDAVFVCVFGGGAG